MGAGEKISGELVVTSCDGAKVPEINQWLKGCHFDKMLA
jgi:hypothetical protein